MRDQFLESANPRFDDAQELLFFFANRILHRFDRLAEFGVGAFIMSATTGPVAT